MSTRLIKKLFSLHHIFIMLFSLILSSVSFAETIAIIGTGNVGSSLGKNWAQKGHTIVYGSRDASRDTINRLVQETGHNARATSQAGSVVGADVVVLAVPWNVAEDVVRSLGDLSGKIILDVTNPRDINEAGDTVPPSQESSTEKFKRLVPGADIVKCFNHMPAFLMETPEAAGFEYSMGVAGDDRAVAWVENIATEMGFRVAVLGGIRETRLLEAFYSAAVNMRRRGYGYTLQFHKTP